MKNRVIDAALDYHNRTKHSSESIWRNPHYLDWENQPLPFKIYPQSRAASTRFAFIGLRHAGADGDFDVDLRC